MADADQQKQLKIVTAKLKQPRKLIVPDDSNAADFIKTLQKKGREAYLGSLSDQDLGIRYRSLLCYTQTVCLSAASLKLGEQRDNAEFVGLVEQIFRLYLCLQFVGAYLTEKAKKRDY
jgi:hypothetical protein